MLMTNVDIVAENEKYNIICGIYKVENDALN
jgi:hypothetical protein